MNRRLGGDAPLNAPIREDGASGEWRDWLVDESPDQETTLAASEEFDNRRKALRECQRRSKITSAGRSKIALPGAHCWGGICGMAGGFARSRERSSPRAAQRRAAAATARARTELSSVMPRCASCITQTNWRFGRQGDAVPSTGVSGRERLERRLLWASR